MNLNNARIVDETIGTFCCFILSKYNSIIHFFALDRKKTPLNNTINILLMKFWGMGSIVLASPAIRAIRNKYPDAHITFLTFKGNREIIESLRLVNTIMEVNNDRILNFLFNLPGLFLKLRRKKFNLVIDFEFFTRFSAITSYLVGKNKRIGYFDKLAYRGNLHTKKVLFDTNQHVINNFLNLAQAAGSDTANQELVHLHVDRAADVFIEQWLEKRNIVDKHRIIIINVNASRLSFQRRWPKENYIEIIDILSNYKIIKVVLLGSKSDHTYVSSLHRLCAHKDNIINTAGEFTVPQLLSLIKKSVLLITNDSGPLHFAVALSVPTISFFGPETPELYGPIGDNHIVFYKKLHCTPCIHAINAKQIKCTNPNCLYMISVSEVMKKLYPFLNNLLE